MWYILKGLYLNYKMLAYEKAITGCTVARTKIRAKQAKFSSRYEIYIKKVNEHKAGK